MGREQGQRTMTEAEWQRQGAETEAEGQGQRCSGTVRDIGRQAGADGQRQRGIGRWGVAEGQKLT
jgi:hypothetical protein